MGEMAFARKLIKCVAMATLARSSCAFAQLLLIAYEPDPPGSLASCTVILHHALACGDQSFGCQQKDNDLLQGRINDHVFCAVSGSACKDI
jgi:hypothetical protein